MCLRYSFHNLEIPYFYGTIRMNEKSNLPSQLGFKLFYNETQLLYGDYFNSYVAPLSLGRKSKLEGTPSIYDIVQRTTDGYLVVDASMGFHFNNENGIDQVAYGYLQNFGPTVLESSFVGQEEAVKYNDLFIGQGAIGNIGQRAPGAVYGVRFNIQEANIGSQPPTIWEDWRVWLYFYGPDESDVPKGGDGAYVVPLKVVTHSGSTAVGNPSYTKLPCPSDLKAENMCIFVSYFLFGEGAAPGEAGVAAFFKYL